MIVFVIVFYNCDISSSKTYTSFLSADRCEDYDLYLWDNGCSNQSFKIKTGVYVHAPENPGLSRAYNSCIDTYPEAKWIVTLDQDTSLPNDFITRLNKTIENTSNLNVGAIVPNVFVKGSIVSPIKCNGVFNRLSAIVCGSYIRFINSGACLNTTALKMIGGYSEEYPLDYLDVWVSDTLSRHGYEIISSRVDIQHDLSISNPKTLSRNRINSLLGAEKKYYYTFGLRGIFLFKAKMILRILRSLYSIRQANKYYIHQMIGMLF